MHEVGLAHSIIKIAEDAATTNGATSVAAIAVVIGGLAGVEQTSLAFAFDAIKAGTIAENAELILTPVEPLGRCTECGKESKPDTFFALCPHCNAPTLEIIAGKEFYVEYIDI